MSDEYRCSFCGAPRSEVRLMVISPRGTTICDECVIEAFKVMVKHNGAGSRDDTINCIPQESQEEGRDDQ